MGSRCLDHGTGISPDKMEHVFDRFYRGEEVPVVSGFGLVLPIAKSLVGEMGGMISIESRVGKGRTVILRFVAI